MAVALEWSTLTSGAVCWAIHAQLDSAFKQLDHRMCASVCVTLSLQEGADRSSAQKG